MISKCIVFLFAALMLANCCSLGTDCAPVSGAPVSGASVSAAPAGWDGLGSAATDDTQTVAPPPKKQARAKREIIAGPLDAAAAEPTSKVQSKDQWDKAQVADQDEETRLKRTLKICSNC
jgi:hypothetical protein